MGSLMLPSNQECGFKQESRFHYLPMMSQEFDFEQSVSYTYRQMSLSLSFLDQANSTFLPLLYLRFVVKGKPNCWLFMTVDTLKS